MPRLDAGMQSGKIVEWLKKEGEFVKRGEPIVVVEGEKTTFEIEAPESGVLGKILVTAGNDVPVAQPIAVIGELESVPPTSPQPQPDQTKSQPPARQPVPSERIIASPAARRLAQEHGVDIARVKGTGPGGRITSEDILAVAKQKSEQTTTFVKKYQPAILKSVKLQGIRKSVAERLSFSARTAVATTLTMEVDASELVKLKNREGHISFTALVVKAVAKALERHQAVNSTIDGEEVIIYSDVNVCVAMHTDQGLVAPVIRGANQKSARNVDAEIRELSRKARENQLALEELTGGTFTVTNLGAQDVETFTPIINPPQCAILGLGRIAYKPFASGEQETTRPATTLTLVFDHRIVDGVPAARFLIDVRKGLEEPESLL